MDLQNRSEENQIFKARERRIKLLRLSKELVFNNLLGPLIREDGTIAGLEVKGLPRGVEIIGISFDSQFYSDNLVLKLWHESFPVVYPGWHAEFVEPEITARTFRVIGTETALEVTGHFNVLPQFVEELAKSELVTAERKTIHFHDDNMVIACGAERKASTSTYVKENVTCSACLEKMDRKPQGRICPSTGHWDPEPTGGYLMINPSEEQAEVLLGVIERRASLPEPDAVNEIGIPKLVKKECFPRKGD